MKKLLILLFAAMPFVAFADGKSRTLYVISPTYVGSGLFQTELAAEIVPDCFCNTNYYQCGLKPKYYTKVELKIGDLAAVNGRKFKVEDKDYYFSLLKNSFIEESEGIKICKKYKYVSPDHINVEDYASRDIKPQKPAVLSSRIEESLKLASNPNNGTGVTTVQPAIAASDVDMNIPETGVKAENTFALIIANENYEFVDDVKFAINDGEIFREYCIKTLGIPERQVWLYKNASAGIISGGVDKLLQAMEIFDKPKIIVYYCGHGIPDDKTGDAYIIPTDGKGTNVATCYSLNRLYTTLSSSKASSVTYFMDACFTGANRDGSMLVAARGVAREAKKEVITGNTVVFSAASGDETAMPYTEKCHGLFTYFLLKKLQETKGNVNYGELAEYINSNVKKEAFLTNEKPQNPVVATSETNMKNWKTMNVR